MADIPLGRADYSRRVPKEARIQLLNRYFESNPVLTDTGSTLIARPAMRRGLAVGNGPIRGVYSQPGSFSDCLFTVSDDGWYRVDADLSVTLLQSGILGGAGFVSQAATGNIGTTPEYCFMADGSVLYLYVENGFALGTISGTPANGDVMRLGSMYYKFTSGSVNAGTPLGTVTFPWLVALGGTAATAWQNFADAVANRAVGGSEYSTALEVNPDASPVSNGVTAVTVRATAVGAPGNGVVTTETGAAIAWTAGTLSGGGSPSVTQVQTPDDVGVIAVAYIASFVVVVPAQGAGINGQFFWIDPGETTIDPLNFATAERSPDPINNVVVFADQFWLPGSNTTEVWYFTGDPNSPVARLQGITFDRGTWAGTSLQVKESMMIIDSDGGVFQVAGGLQRISNPSIEERIRGAIQHQAATTPGGI